MTNPDASSNPADCSSTPGALASASLHPSTGPMAIPPSPILTTLVGSYPIPAWLSALPSRAALRDAVMVALKTQELAGIDVLTDGELGRFDPDHPETNGMIEYFIRPMEGLSTQLSRAELAEFRRLSPMAFRTQPAGVVRGPIGEGQLNLPADWEWVRNLASKPLKFTLTSPYMLARTLLDRQYGGLRDLTLALARVLAAQVAQIDAAVIQIDEANLPGNPSDAAWVHEPINLILDQVRGRRALHLCFGNYGGQSIQKGLWKDLIAFLSRLHVDHLILEFARRGYDELELFKDLRPDIALGLGVIDIKDNEIEPPDLIARRLEQACKTLGAARIQWVHPDCGFWMLQRSVADRKIASLVAGRDRFLRG